MIRYLLALLAGCRSALNFRGADVVEVLEQVGAAHGFRPASGSTKVPSSSAATSTCGPISAASPFSRPGTPTDTDVIE
ncbi:hypothetical protein KIO73_31360 [Chelatococcus asaccharovorans]|nr:hypothetical protein [Chelatococcus asaccharovorans]